MQDAGGGRVLRGVAGRGSSYIWTGEKILCTWARLLIGRAGHVVRIGCRGGFQAGRDAGGRLLSAGSRRAAGRRAGRQAGQGWRGRRVGAGACRCWAGCPGHQAGCYPSYCTKFRLKIQHNAENDASCFDTFTA